MYDVYSAHQPDLLPYSGFWYKMAKADLFDLKIWDQYVHKGYQRRVKMRDIWVTLPLVKGPATEPIISKRITEDARSPGRRDRQALHARQEEAADWDKYGPMICDEIRGAGPTACGSSTSG